MIYQQGASTRHLGVLSILLALSLLGQTKGSCLHTLKKLYTSMEHESKTSLDSYKTVFNLSPSDEEICPNIPKHVIDASDINKTLENLYKFNTLYNYRLVEVRHYHKDLSYPEGLLENLKNLNSTMSLTSRYMIKELSIPFRPTQPPRHVINDGDHAKKIYGLCVLYRIKNLLDEGNPIVQSLNVTDVCKKRNRRRRLLSMLVHLR